MSSLNRYKPGPLINSNDLQYEDDLLEFVSEKNVWGSGSSPERVGKVFRVSQDATGGQNGGDGVELGC